MAIRTHHRVALAALLVQLVAACRVEPVPEHRTAPPAAASVSPAPVARPVPPAPVVVASEVVTCRAELQRRRAIPSLPADPLESRRPELFERAKADGVVFVHAPEPSGLTDEGRRLRHAILDAPDPVKALYEAYPTLLKRRDLGRQVLLTDGYLYAVAPALAAALSALVRPEDLFLDREIWIERGAERIRAIRGSVEGAPAYVFAEGASKGERVKLFLFDRVTADPATLSVPLHRDLTPLKASLGFDEMRMVSLEDDAIVAELRYGTVWVPTVLASTGAALERRCEAIPEGREAEVKAVRAVASRRLRVLDQLRAVIDQQVAEALPFDEPKTEVGQQDGKLRQEWSWAYRYGRTRFEFNDDKYRVFDWRGRPRVPQVCIDFVTDTFERASGSWYRGQGEPRERTSGRLDFGVLGIANERSVEHFIEFAKAHPEWFETMEIPEEERVPYFRRDAFFADLTEHRDRYQPGDVVTIYGLRNDGKMHHHSFFVYSSDPVTGAPSLVAANAGRPRVRPFEGEMQSAPRRSIRARVRPLLPWLEFVTAGTALPAAPPSADRAVPRPTTI